MIEKDYEYFHNLIIWFKQYIKFQPNGIIYDYNKNLYSVANDKKIELINHNNQPSLYI